MQEEKFAFFLNNSATIGKRGHRQLGLARVSPPYYNGTVSDGAFYLSSLLAYWRFCPLEIAPSNERRRWEFYWLALFVGAMLNKTVACTLPLTQPRGPLVSQTAGGYTWSKNTGRWRSPRRNNNAQAPIG